MQSYGQYCPMARGAEIFATRWTPIIVRNLLLGCETFGQLRAGAPGMPRSLLSQRLAMLERYGVIERSPNRGNRGSRYTLTEMGRELSKVLDALGSWGERWLEMTPEHHEPYVVLWGLSIGLSSRPLPPQRIVVRFDIPACQHPRFWLVVGEPKPEVCIKFPGYEENLIVTTTPETLAKWHTGQINLGQAMHGGTMNVTGRRELIHTLASWGGLGRLTPLTPQQQGKTPRHRTQPAPRKPPTRLPPPLSATRHKRTPA
jgi:DNA-binding HxlR family transcriptional regulator